jgi:hypothetical protein
MNQECIVPNGMVLDSGRRPRTRRKARNSWTKAKESRFLSALADSCNVTFAAKKARVSTSAIYERRKANASFRNGWRTALREGYAKLELILLERALVGTEKVIERRDGSIERMREYSNSLAVALLRMHRDEVAEQESDQASSRDSGEDEVEEVRQRIARKLERLNRQLTDLRSANDSGDAGAVA